MYAIVDIETTGSHANANGITEVAICLHNGIEVVERYETLINPGMNIPVYIRALTGISNEMVEDAPRFSAVAAEIFKLLDGKIFVAHNVNFDYSFLRHHLSNCGYTLNSNKLCTVRLGRKILPGYPSYSLGKLCRQLGIENHSRHRAGGDADATARLFSILIANDKDEQILKSLKHTSKEQRLPANLSEKDIHALPYTPGIYYFHDEKGKVIYVGKAKNIKKRVCSHFTGNNTGLQRQEFLKNIYQITYQECGSELIAFVTEAVEIKRLWPKYNRSLKRYEHAYGLFDFVDQAGHLRLAVDKRRKYSEPIYTCNNLMDGYNLLSKLIDQFQLCTKMCFIQKSTQPCRNVLCVCNGGLSMDEYNRKVELAIAQLKDALPTFAIRDDGRTMDEHSCLLIEKGKFYGMGYISHYFNANNIEQLKDYLTPYPGNDYIRNMISNYAMRHPERMMVF